ncbi:MAG TPA: phosphotransferase, partial [Ilumatobacteraceae bacterium]
MDDDLSDRLAAVLGSVEVSSLTQLSGGASRETWRFQADGVPLILQRQRPGDEREIAVEIAALRAAHAAGVPTANIVTASVDPAALDAPFMILEHVDGETTPRKILRDDAFAAARRALPTQLARALVVIHSIDPESIPGIADVDQVDRYREVLDTVG